MATQIEDLKGYDVGLIDSDTDESCITERVVDITNDCPGMKDGNRCLFLFTRAQRGRIVKMVQPYEGEKATGPSRHFFVDEFDSRISEAPRDNAFGFDYWARKLGLEKTQLRSLIEKHAPA